MKIYRPGEIGRKSVFVAPGAMFPTSEFLDDEGKPRQFNVQFVNGAAEVPDGLGRYMVDHELASNNPIIIARAI